MTNLKQITDTLIEKYNNAVDFYRNEDFEHFFGDMRKAVEAICKAIIFDALQDDENANKILDGKKEITFNAVDKKYEILDSHNGCIPSNSKLLFPAEYALYHRHPEIRFNYSKNASRGNHLNRDVNNAYAKLSIFFSDASSLGSHSDESDIDGLRQSQYAVCTITAFLDFISQKRYITSELQKTLENLRQIPIDFPSQRRKKTEDELKDVLGKTYSFGENEGGYKCIIILPTKNPGLKSDELEALFKLPCAMVIDFGTRNSADIYKSIDQNSTKSKIRIVAKKEDCVEGKSMVNWFFALGDNEVGDDITNNYKDWRKKRFKILSEVMKGVVEKGSTDKYFIMDFLEDAKYAKYIFDHLNDVFGDEETAINRVSQIFSFSQNSEVHRELEEWKEDCSYNITFASHITLADFLTFVNGRNPSNETCQSRCQVTLKDINFSEDEFCIYNEVGINIFMPRGVASKNGIGDFYTGYEITWRELELDYDIKRSKYETFKNKIVSLIRNSTKNTLEYILKHNPGAGATTMARRLAYDLYKQCWAENNDFVCVAVFLDEYNSKTIEYLSNLSTKIDNRFIVAIIDSGRISVENFDMLFRNMDKQNRKVLFIRLFRTGQKEITGGDNTTTLPSKLTEEEIELFYNKYKNQAATIGKKEFPASISDLASDLEVVDFPLLLNNETTQGLLLYNYADEYINHSHFTEELKRFCGFVAFAYYYAERPLNQNLVGLLYKNRKIIASSDIKEIKNALDKMLFRTKDENGRPDGAWRPRFSAFCEPILRAVWGVNWKSKLPTISKEFIDECSNMGTAIGKKDEDMLHAMFILRPDDNFKNDSDGSKAKFSKLIEDVLKAGFQPESIFKRLIETYPNDTAFMGHFGRYLFEKAYSEKNTKSDDGKYFEAEKYISRAIETSPGIADNYHILGMLYLRKIQALKKELESLKSKENFDADDIEVRMLDWADEAKSGFEKSQYLNPASPYGYTSICKLYKECIEFAKELKGSDDFSFCDEEEKYMEISELLNNSLSQLGNICQAYEDSVDYMRQSRSIYEKIKLFQYKVLGQASEAVERYRNLYRQANDKYKKTYFGKQQIEAMLYRRTEGLTQEKQRYYKAFAMGKLKGKDRNEIEEILNYLRRQDDVNCYENLFWFKMSSNEEFSFDDAIDMLQEWLNLCKNDDRPQNGKLKANFYLAVCYSAMAINSEEPRYDYVDNAKRYFEDATKLADTFEIKSINSLAFLGEEEDVHCILLPSKKDHAKKVNAKIEKIDGRKGYAIIPNCGVKLKVFFSNKDYKYNSLRDEHKTFITGSIGFRYDGLRIYDSYIETDLTPKEKAETVKDDYEEDNTVPINTNDEHDNHDNLSKATESVDTETNGKIGNCSVKVLDKIDLTKIQINNPRECKENNNADAGCYRRFIGKIDAERKYVWARREHYQIDKMKGYKHGCSPKEYDYENEEEFYFEKKNRPNYKTGGTYTYAINVRPAKEENM